MVEPMSHEFREALKKANAGLTDEIIDRIEELVHRRFNVEPGSDRSSIAGVDEELRGLIEDHAPHWGEVSERFQERRRR